MKKSKGFFTSLNEWIVKQAEQTELEYKLSPSTELPSLVDLKEAHHNLLQGYVNALAAVSRLSFFVGTFEVYKTKRPPSAGRLFYYILSRFSPFRLLIIRPLLNLLIQSHIRSKLREIESVYIQLPSTFPLSFKNKEKYSNWLQSAREECRNISGTLSAPNSIAEFIKSGFSFLVAVGIVTALVDALKNFDWTSLKTIILFAFLFSIPSSYAYFFIDSSFRAKRDVFLGISNKEELNIYLLENKLFSLLHRGKSFEFPFDHTGTVLFALPLLVYLGIGNAAVREMIASNNAPNTYIVNIFPALIGIIVIAVLSAIIFPIIKRTKTGLM